LQVVSNSKRPQPPENSDECSLLLLLLDLLIFSSCCGRLAGGEGGIRTHDPAHKFPKLQPLFRTPHFRLRLVHRLQAHRSYRRPEKFHTIFCLDSRPFHKVGQFLRAAKISSCYPTLLIFDRTARNRSRFETA
jgi:hypothetical protein